MNLAYALKLFSAGAGDRDPSPVSLHKAEKGSMSLMDAEPGQTYTIKEINTDDDEMNSFLFRLGCYQGEPITLISKKRKSCIVVIKDSRYSFDKMLSEAVII